MIEEISEKMFLTKGEETQIKIQLRTNANRPSKNWNEGQKSHLVSGFLFHIFK